MSRAPRPRQPLPTRVGSSTAGAEPTRVVLPARIEDTAPLPAAYHEELERGLHTLGVALHPTQRAVIDGHARLVLAWTAAINLTAIREPAAVARMHVIDSLAGLMDVAGEWPLQGAASAQGDSPEPVLRILDLGSGGGYPGIVLAAMLPEASVVLADSVAKKTRFLGTAIGATGMDERVAAVTSRAEALATDPTHRSRYDVVAARAVGSLAELVELSLPLLRVGGRLVAWKRGDLEGALGVEIDAGRRASDAIGGSEPRTRPVSSLDLPGHVIIAVTKQRPTAGAYPRDPALRRRSPW